MVARLARRWVGEGRGLIVSQALTLYTIPATYIYMEAFGEWPGRAVGRRSRKKSPGLPKHRSLVPAGRYPPPTRGAAE